MPSIPSTFAPPKSTLARSIPPLAAAVLALAAFYLVGTVFLQGYALDLGSLNFPAPRYLTFVAFWTLFGGVFALTLALAIARQVKSVDVLAGQWNAIPERRFLAWTCFGAFVIPLSLRLAVLQGAPLTDDEGAYRFAAELWAAGRFFVPSPPLKLFFDQSFIVNDGRMYAVYFPGWPVLLAVGVLLHVPGLVNPLLSALTVPPLYKILRRFAGPAWAKAGILLFLAAPFVQIAAATLLSHTSCLMALAWCLSAYLSTGEPGASWRQHALFAAAFSLAFCIRPQSALPLGLPLLVSWAWRAWRLPARSRRLAVVAFAVPTVLAAAFFLGTLWVQNGSPFTFGYTRYNQYMADNGYRFTSIRKSDVTTVAGFEFAHPDQAIARTALGLFRLNTDLFGWPSSLALLVAACLVPSRRNRLLWWMVGAYILLLLFQRDWGIDTFGPVHAFELVLPILPLTIVGFRNLAERLDWAEGQVNERPAWRWSAFSPALLVALIVAAWLGFAPVRLEGVGRIANQLNLALRAPDRAGIHNAIVFAPYPVAPPCRPMPWHYVFFRPPNDPFLRNDVLWVNDLGATEDRRLLAVLPGRTGYVLRWTPQCKVELLRIP